MREIFFRGKGIDGNWYYGVPLVFTDDYVCMTAPHTYNKKVEPNTLGQFTGLTDKNGKKIFEGDIIAWNDGETDTNGICFDDELFLIEFSCKEVAFVASYEVDGEERLDGLDTSYATVIGNIHDNPKLLKGGADND